MKTAQYFIKALQANMFYKKIWVLEIFSVCEYLDESDSELEEFRPYIKNNNLSQLFTKIDGEEHELEEYVEGAPLARFRSRLDLKAGDLANVKKDITTTYGNALINCHVFIYSFGDKVDFITGKINTKKFEKHLADNLMDTPTNDEERSPDKFYVDEYLRYGEALGTLEGYSLLCVQAASEATMLPNPVVLKRRDELLEEYKDRLNDPAIIAKIQMELAELDKQTLADDISKDFYLKDKSWDVIRMKRFNMYGLDGGFGDKSRAQLIKNSLEEGWELEAMPAMVDALRSGSYARGKETALGGATVKEFYRTFQNVTVSEEDCGNNHGFIYDITEEDKSRFIGLNVVDGNTHYMLTEENIDKHIGGKFELRTPMLCRVKAPSFCKVCVGQTLASRPDAIHIVTADVGSAFMGARMSQMHGSSLRTKKYDINKAIT